MDNIGNIVSIHLDRNLKEPLYLQLYRGIVNLIENGALKANEKLPPIRKLAKSMNINTITVANAYKLLEKEGYITTKIGSGSYVIPTKRVSCEESILKTKVVKYNFASASIPPSLFPTEEFKEAIVRVLDSEGGYAFESQEIAGYKALRETINETLLASQGIDVDTDNIYVVSGAQQGIEIIAKLLLDYQDVVYIERPTYPGAISAFKSRSAKIVEISLNEDGLDINELERMLKITPPKLLYIIPNFQNPTGYSYSEEKKSILLEFAQKYDFIILEDDHLNELYYQEKAKPLKAFDKNNRVFYIKSFSKLLMPGLRLGFIVSPEIYGEKILEIKYLSDISSSSLTQKALNILLKEESFKKHVDKIRNIFKKRWEIIIKSLKKYMPQDVFYSIPKGGLYLWINLPKGYYSRDLYYKALEREVIFMPGDVFLSEPSPIEGFRISFTQISESDIEEGIKILADCIKSFLAEPYYKRPILGKDYEILI